MIYDYMVVFYNKLVTVMHVLKRKLYFCITIITHRSCDITTFKIDFYIKVKIRFLNLEIYEIHVIHFILYLWLCLTTTGRD